MKVRLFVTFSASLLSLWLGATYVRVVPMETYGDTSAPVQGLPVSEEHTIDPQELVASHP